MENQLLSEGSTEMNEGKTFSTSEEVQAQPHLNRQCYAT